MPSLKQQAEAVEAQEPEPKYFRICPADGSKFPLAYPDEPCAACCEGCDALREVRRESAKMKAASAKRQRRRAKWLKLEEAKAARERAKSCS